MTKGRLDDPYEHDIQATFFKYVRAKAQTNWKYKNVFSIPNARKCSIPAARYYDAEGREKGMLDVFVAIPNFSREACGAVIEFKRLGKKPSADQVDWIKRLTKAGYLVKVIDNIDDAIHFIDQYIREAN